MPRFTPWYGFVRGLVRIGFFKLTGGLSTVGESNVPLEGPLIVASNHVSNLDPPAVACTLPRQIAFMAKAELFRVPVFGSLIRSLGSFPVHRGEADTEAMRLAIRLLSEGRAVLVFPEGTRGDGVTLGEFNRGVGLLAKRSRAKVLPVGIAGTHRKMPKGRLCPRFGRVRVAFGVPFTFDEAGADREAFTSELRRRILALCAEQGLALSTSASEPSSTAPGRPCAASEPSPPSTV
jgi:1-acyl-sn-glycerol-3-phosphate acyltransferase